MKSFKTALIITALIFLLGCSGNAPEEEPKMYWETDEPEQRIEIIEENIAFEDIKDGETVCYPFTKYNPKCTWVKDFDGKYHESCINTLERRETCYAKGSEMVMNVSPHINTVSSIFNSYEGIGRAVGMIGLPNASHETILLECWNGTLTMNKTTVYCKFE